MRVFDITVGLAVAAVALFLGCGGSAVGHMNAEEMVVTTASEQQSAAVDTPINYFAYQYYVNGLLAEEMGDYATAADAYTKALNYYSGSYQISFSLAEAYARIGEPEKSLDVLKGIYPRDADVYRLSAVCFRMLGDTDNFKGAYLNVARLDTTDADAYSILGTLYAKSHDVDSAIWAFEALSRIDIGDYRVWNQLGSLYLDDGRVDDAKAAYSKSLEFDSTEQNLAATVNLADIYQKNGQPDSAAALLEDATVIDTSNTLVLSWLVSYYTEKGEFVRALPHAENLVREQPEDIPQQRRLGMIYYYLDSLDQAESIFARLVDGGDQFDFNHHFLGLIASERKDFAKARDEFLIVTRMADTLASGWANLGLAYRNLKEPDSEIASYKEGLSRTTGDEKGQEELMFLLGGAYEQRGASQDAEQVFEDIIKKAPDYHPALNYLGYMLADKGERLDYALSLISKAVELAPDNAAYLDSYGWVYYRMGNFDKAVDYLENAARLDKDAVIFDHLGDAYQALGKTELAREWWQKALELKPDDTGIKEKLEH